MAFPGLVHANAIAVFVTCVQYLAETLLCKYIIGNANNK